MYSFGCTKRKQAQNILPFKKKIEIRHLTWNWMSPSNVWNKNFVWTKIYGLHFGVESGWIIPRSSERNRDRNTTIESLDYASVGGRLQPHLYKCWNNWTWNTISRHSNWFDPHQSSTGRICVNHIILTKKNKKIYHIDTNCTSTQPFTSKIRNNNNNNNNNNNQHNPKKISKFQISNGSAIEVRSIPSTKSK